MPTAPAFIFAAAISKTSIVLVWQPPERPNGIIMGYQIRYQPVTAVGNLIFLVQLMGNLAESRQHSLKGLEENTTYSLSVAASTATTLGQMSLPETKKTFGPQGSLVMFLSLQYLCKECTNRWPTCSNYKCNCAGGWCMAEMETAVCEYNECDWLQSGGVYV